MNFKKERIKIQDKLRKARADKDWAACRMYEARLEELAEKQVNTDRHRRGFGQLADEYFTKEQEERFTADIIEMTMCADLLQNAVMKVEEHILRIPNFSSPDVLKLKKVISDLGSFVALIDKTSESHPTKNDNNHAITLSEHYMNMVDEAETQILGWQNMIHKIIKQRTGFQ